MAGIAKKGHCDFVSIMIGVSVIGVALGGETIMIAFSIANCSILVLMVENFIQGCL